jgi:hypothetical protein
MARALSDEQRIEREVAKVEDCLRRIGAMSPEPLHRNHADSLAERVREFGYDVVAELEGERS